MTLAAQLAAVEEAAAALRDIEAQVEPARATFRRTLLEAHDAGASYGLLGRVTGRSRQRIAELVHEARAS
jgi:hypothetical protein